MPNEEMDAVRIELARQVSALKASNAELVAALDIVLKGLHNGNIKAMPLMRMNETALSIHPESLTDILTAALAKAKL